MAAAAAERRRNEAKKTDTPSPDDVNFKRVVLDCTTGHVGITCSNCVHPAGVLLDYCDPGDLAAKAGLSKGDVVIRANGNPVVEHQSLVAAVKRAAQRDKSSKERLLELHYLPAALVATEQAAALARRPPPKSLILAYLLLLVSPPLGLHHLYLGRDEHAFLHLMSLGGVFGIGCVRDMLCLPRYVGYANEAPKYLGALRAEQLRYPFKPRRGVQRCLAMLGFGLWFAFLASCLPPPTDEVPWPEEVAWFLDGALQAVGCSVAVYVVGILPALDGSFAVTLRSALGAALLARVVGFSWALWPTLGAFRGFGASMVHVEPGSTVQRRVRVSLSRRAVVFATAVGVGWGCVGFGLYQNGAVTTVTPDGGVHKVRFKDAVHHVLRSPFVRNMPSFIYGLATEGFSIGWEQAFRKVYNSLDLAGEAHACEVLGLSAGCLESFSEVKRAYRGLALEYHPDKHAGASDAKRDEVATKFREVQEAYEHLQSLQTQKKREEEGAG